MASTVITQNTYCDQVDDESTLYRGASGRVGSTASSSASITLQKGYKEHTGQ
jgi:hypothetical protein